MQCSEDETLVFTVFSACTANIAFMFKTAAVFFCYVSLITSYERERVYECDKKIMKNKHTRFLFFELALSIRILIKN